MTSRERLKREVECISEEMARDVLEYLKRVRSIQAQAVMDTAVASEPVLARDWNRPEEDEAWADL